MVLGIIAVIAVLAVALGLFWALGIVAALIGAVFMGITMTVIKLFIVPRFEARDQFRLATDNVRLDPEKLVVRYDELKRGYVVDCYYHVPETGRQCIFTTEPMAEDPTPLLSRKRLTIVTNRIDYSNYYVDISELKDRI